MYDAAHVRRVIRTLSAVEKEILLIAEHQKREEKATILLNAQRVLQITISQVMRCA